MVVRQCLELLNELAEIEFKIEQHRKALEAIGLEVDDALILERVLHDFQKENC